MEEARIGAVEVNMNPAALYLDSLGTEASRRGMVSPLNLAARILNPSLATGNEERIWNEFPWETLTPAMVRYVISQIRGASGTRKKALAAMKGAARGAWETQKMPTETYRQIQGIKGRGGIREPSGRHIAGEEIAALLVICHKDPGLAGLRDAALISLTAATGARRAEIASVQVGGLEELEGGRMKIRIRGKGDRQRSVYLENGAAAKVRSWWKCKFERGGKFLFCPIRKDGGAVWNERLSTTALDKILQKRAAEAAIQDISWHDFRRTAAGNLLDAKVDISTVARILGHANVETTARYDRRGERAKMMAAGVTDMAGSSGR